MTASRPEGGTETTSIREPDWLRVWGIFFLFGKMALPEAGEAIQSFVCDALCILNLSSSMAKLWAEGCEI